MIEEKMSKIYQKIFMSIVASHMHKTLMFVFYEQVKSNFGLQVAFVSLAYSSSLYSPR
jgi:hypothetical protein